MVGSQVQKGGDREQRKGWGRLKEEGEAQRVGQRERERVGGLRGGGHASRG